jgi:hypothetical protein
MYVGHKIKSRRVLGRVLCRGTTCSGTVDPGGVFAVLQRGSQFLVAC